MIYIDRPGTPGFWSEFKRKHNKLQYKELSDTEEGTELIRKLRGYNIGLQHGLCAYCCRSIDVDTSLNEHIKPQGKAEYADLSMDYDNIVACCRDKKHAVLIRKMCMMVNCSYLHWVRTVSHISSIVITEKSLLIRRRENIPSGC